MPRLNPAAIQGEPGTGFEKRGGKGPFECGNCEYFDGSSCGQDDMVKKSKQPKNQAGRRIVEAGDCCGYVDRKGGESKSVAPDFEFRSERGSEMSIERRFVKGAEVRATESGQIEGHAAVFNQEYVMWDTPSFRVVEVIKPGAFDKVLADKDDARCLFNHDPNYVLGRVSAGTLKLSADNKGLAFSCELPPTSAGNDVRALIKRGDVTGCSFGFTVEKQNRIEEDDNGKTLIRREILQIKELFDAGPVTYPAYEGTDVGARSVELRSIFPDGVPDKLRQELREIVDVGTTIADTEADPGDGGGMDPDDDGDDDTTAAGDTDQDYMDASLMADHYQAKAEFHDQQADAHERMAGFCADRSEALPPDHEMRSLYDQMSQHHGSMADMHDEMSSHYGEMQDAAYADSQRSLSGTFLTPEGKTVRAFHCPGGKVRTRDGKVLERAAAKTKRVAGEDLPMSAFAYHAKPDDLSTWKLPIRFKSEEKTKRHIRNALARWNQTDMPDAAEKAKARTRLDAAAKKYGIGQPAEKDKKSAPLVDIEQAKARTATLMEEMSLSR